MRPMISFFTGCAVIIFISNCQPKIDRDAAIAELIRTETNFSQYAADHGTGEAFRTFMADSAVMFRKHPVKGRDSIMSQLFSKPSKSKLSWSSMFADVALSGDLGYTYGPYEWVVPDSINGDKKYFGYFMTVWQKQKDGSWKFVLDTGTEPELMEPIKEK